MHKVLEINQVKAIISKHLNKKIIDNLLKLGLTFYVQNQIVINFITIMILYYMRKLIQNIFFSAIS